jgi:hypothetical protein
MPNLRCFRDFLTKTAFFGDMTRLFRFAAFRADLVRQELFRRQIGADAPRAASLQFMANFAVFAVFPITSFEAESSSI